MDRSFVSLLNRFIGTFKGWTCLAVAILILGLTGCTCVGPNYRAPCVRMACEWSRADEEGMTTEPADHGLWWENFDDPILTCLIERAFGQNLSLQAACERIREGRAHLGIATGLLYPQTQRLFGYRIKGKLSENIPPISTLPDNLKPLVDTSNDLFSLSFDVSWELDFWGQFRRGIEAACSDYWGAVAGYNAAMVLLSADVAKDYVNIRLLQQQLDVAQQNVDIQSRSLSIADVRYRNEVSTELDVQEALVQLNDTEAAIPELQHGLVLAKNSLTVLLGLAPGELDTILEEVHDIPKPPAEVALGVPADLLRRRPDVRQAELRARAQSARIGVATGALYPHIGLAGTVGYQATTSSKLFDSDSIGWKYGPGFRWDILNYGRLVNAISVEDSLFKQAMFDYQEVVLRAQAEVESAISGFIKGQEELESRNTSAESAQRSVELALIQYREGIADFNRVLDAQRALLHQQMAALDTHARIAYNLIALYKGLGGGWQQPTEASCLCECHSINTDEPNKFMTEEGNS